MSITPSRTIGIGVMFPLNIKTLGFVASRLALALKAKLILFHMLINKAL
ncbi:hypothetical protein [Winogradskyella immobilis]|uniref:Uncharacterized protein n=1 Tax=Winogradskyella immobilis TaxID=2816852 RepID=A0ABS8EJP9_9FLAO|nr:hypothetical protein [Winogradskyella immobilis]MCC1483424.1 hypothetical protein [Winogradskyella immobilis]MCG0015518.1 hypothetical protein [Winogradskyella immobilis]